MTSYHTEARAVKIKWSCLCLYDIFQLFLMAGNDMMNGFLKAREDFFFKNHRLILPSIFFFFFCKWLLTTAHQSTVGNGLLTIITVFFWIMEHDKRIAVISQCVEQGDRKWIAIAMTHTVQVGKKASVRSVLLLKQYSLVGRKNLFYLFVYFVFIY